MGTVGEVLLRAILGDAVWEGLPDGVQQVFTENGPAIVAEDRGGLLDVSAEQLGAIDAADARRRSQGLAGCVRRGDELTAAAIPSSRIEWVDGGHLIDAAHPQSSPSSTRCSAATDPACRPAPARRNST